MYSMTSWVEGQEDFHNNGENNSTSGLVEINTSSIEQWGFQDGEWKAPWLSQGQKARAILSAGVLRAA